MNILQLNEMIKLLALHIPNVNSYFGDDVYDVLNQKEVKYACMSFNLESINQTDKTRIFNGVLYYADRLTEDKSNKLHIYTDADNAIANVVTSMIDVLGFDVTDYQVVMFEQKFADFLAGGYARLSISVPNSCDVVMPE